ncbi:major facilitator superfamily domain-containing protein [Staphylotrichum tortipilum]|uniref:Major facilitator superfamily domain-containing protein n=1 Tax=Staphylotrichum tortipilum TaxID=2831512 RepID=A0AAN6RPC0_9PEZI|nr:major facilitator superfamily domain-containing protein [Staphylotrichum longicolle]
MTPALLTTLHRESGLASLSATGRDALLIILARSCRMFAYGASSLVLALFFAELGFPDSRIGLFMTLTLAGDVALTLGLTLVADRVGRRNTLLVGAGLMIVSGVCFAVCERFWVLLGAAVVGVISATGGDFGPFRAVEESIVAELTDGGSRADVLVWYVTVASLGSAAGTDLSGRIVEGLTGRGWTLVESYHGCFWLYAVMGGVNVVCALMLSERCELKAGSGGQGGEVQDGEREPLLDGRDQHAVEEVAAPADDAKQPPKQRRAGWVAQISRESLSIMTVLWFLLMVDSLADGMANMSLTTYYVDQKFHLPKSALGDIISSSYLLASLTNIFAGPLARYIGLVNTMVFTHIPSSAAVLLFPLAKTVPLTIALLLVRVGLNNMDQAPRAALIAAVVRPEERTAVMGITGMLRTLASTTGPTITGVLADGNRFWVAFVVAGALRLAYDVGLFAMFINIKLHKHEEGGEGAEGVVEGRQQERESRAEP